MIISDIVVSLHMSDDILCIMVAGERNTAMKGSGIPLRMTLGNVQKSYLQTWRTLCYQKKRNEAFLKNIVLGKRERRHRGG